MIPSGGQDKNVKWFETTQRTNETKRNERNIRSFVFSCVRACVRALVRACVRRSCVRACVRAFVRFRRRRRRLRGCYHQCQYRPQRQRQHQNRGMPSPAPAVDRNPFDAVDLIIFGRSRGENFSDFCPKFSKKSQIFNVFHRILH